jgi:hypothetical protein
MNTSGTMASPQAAPPHCYGDPTCWDRNHPECAGGADANYIHPRTGKNVRDRCDYFLQCGARVDIIKNGLIPVSQLTRPPMVTPPPAQARQPFEEYIRSLDQQRRTQISQPQPPPVPSYQPHAMFAPQPQAAPASAWTTNYTVPSFLSAQEVQYSDESRWMPFIRMLGRGLLKAGGMVFAHWWDTHTWRRPPEKKE